MSFQSTTLLGVMLAVGLAVGAGCSSGDVGARAKSSNYDYDVLDAYLSDAKEQGGLSVNDERNFDATAGSKSLDRSAASESSKRPVPVGKFPKGKVFGEWVGKIDMAEAMENAQATGDPELAEMAREMGKAMAEMMSGMFSMSLDLHKNYTFDGLMVSMPIEGNWEQKGDRLILTPTKVMGKTEKEFKQMAKKTAEEMDESYQSDGEVKMTMTSDSFETLELSIAENGKALIAINALDSTDQDLVFRRKQ